MKNYLRLVSSIEKIAIAALVFYLAVGWMNDHAQRRHWREYCQAAERAAHRGHLARAEKLYVQSLRYALGDSARSSRSNLYLHQIRDLKKGRHLKG